MRSSITRLNVLQQDFDVVVSVVAGLLVVESQSVEQLVLDGAVVEASTTGQRHHLLPTTTADERPAAGRDQTQDGEDGEESEQLSLTTFSSVDFLPVLGLDAQPVAVAASAGPEADAGEGGEGLQATGDDGLLTGGWKGNAKHLAVHHFTVFHCWSG